MAKLERALSLARAEATEWRREASAIGAERDQLQASLRRPRSAPSARPGRSPPPARRGEPDATLLMLWGCWLTFLPLAKSPNSIVGN